jgi:ribosome-binding protein aMBF1 (putative translation factor)
LIDFKAAELLMKYINALSVVQKHKNEMRTLDSLLEELWKDFEFRVEYKKLKPFYDISLKMITRRRELGISQKQLSKMSGVKRKVIKNFELSNNNSSNTLKDLVKIMETLGLFINISFEELQEK